MDKDENGACSRNSLVRRAITASNILTSSERKILLSEGLHVAENTPLTKAEEFALKKVRRKLKNKISAQESRRKKKEYVENLEKRVRALDVENELLRKKLETQDQTLRSLTFQISKMKPQDEVDQRISYENKGTQTGICLKCYLKSQAGLDGVREDFKVQTGDNGRIVIGSDLVEERRNQIIHKNEYTELRSLFAHAPRYDTTGEKSAQDKILSEEYCSPRILKMT